MPEETQNTPPIQPQVMHLEDQTLREALQIHPRPLPWQARLHLFEQLLEAGLRRFQVGALVRPDRVPQMAGSDELIQAIGQRPGVEVWALVLNRKGLARARACGLRRVALSASLAPTHSQANLGCSVESGLARCLDLASQALELGLEVRMGLQCAFGGPLLAPPEPERLAEAFRPFHALGVGRLALADTAGRARPLGIAAILKHLREQLPWAELGLHLHGGPGRLALNLEAAWAGGAAWLDASLGGRGGCPFLPNHPPANLPTQTAISFLKQRGIAVHADEGELARTSALLEQMLAYKEVGT